MIILLIRIVIIIIIRAQGDEDYNMIYTIIYYVFEYNVMACNMI